jgi:hypothetical protein
MVVLVVLEFTFLAKDKKKNVHPFYNYLSQYNFSKNNQIREEAEFNRNSLFPYLLI